MSVDTDTWWDAFVENMPTMDSSSSATNSAWALQQHCQTPLEKLILIRLCDGVGGAGVGKFGIASLAEFACVDGQAACDALVALHQCNFIVILEEGLDYTVALPWWKPGCRPASQLGSNIRRLQSRAELRSGLLESQCGACWYCGAKIVGDVRTPHVDHQHPLCRGGADTIENLVMACAPCNLQKRDRTVDEYRAFLIQRDGLDSGFLFYMEAPK